MSVADYCPKCNERTSLPERGVCPWCDTPLRHKRAGGKPAGKHGKLNDAQLRALHHAYVTQDKSVNALAKLIYAKVGYASHHTCSRGIYDGWARLGLERRERIEAVRLACTTHGHGARDRDEKAYREFLKQMRGWNAQQGPGQEQCAAVKVNPPRKGQRCQRPSLEDSDYCTAHDPRRELARQAHLARTRRLLPREDMLPMGPFTEWLRALHAEHGSMRAVARLTDGPYTALCQYAKGQGTNKQPKTTIARSTVEKYATAAGSSVDAIYQREAIAA